MQLLASAILYQPVIEANTGRKLGRVKELIIDPVTCKVEAFLIGTGIPILSSKTTAVLMNDVTELLPYGLIVPSEEALVPVETVTKIKDIQQLKAPILGQKAVTTTGHYLGRITDLAFDPQLGQVTRFQIQDLLRDWLLGTEEVQKITRRAIIFNNAVIEGEKSPMATLAMG